MNAKQRSILIEGTAERRPATYLTSKSTRDTRLSNRSPVRHRKAADVRIVSGRGTEAVSGNARQKNQTWRAYREEQKYRRTHP